jgi:hypothetical protein
VVAVQHFFPGRENQEKAVNNEPNVSPEQRRWRRRWCLTRRTSYWIIGVIVFLICVRLALPYALERYVNRQLNRSKDYSGQIGTVTVHLWRGAYQIHDVHIFKRNGQVPVPFFSARILDLSLQWSELFHGAIVSEIVMQNPSLNFVAGLSAEQSQTGRENNWGDLLKSLTPFDINRLDIKRGQIHFQNPYATPPVDIYLNDLSATATNFNNTRGLTQKLPAGVMAQGTTLGGGNLSLQVHVNPLAKTPTFELTGELTNVDVVALNNFLRAYGKFDVARGDFALFTSFAAKDGNYDGYFKVFFKNLKVFRWEEDKKKDVLEIFWKAIVGTLAAAFKNQPHDQLATKIPVSGSLGNTDVHVWPTITSLLQNAFIKSLSPRVDERVKVEKVDQNQ